MLDHYLDAAIEVPYRGYAKWKFICPFCAVISSKEYKRRERKGSLLWDSRQNSWIFFCARKQSVDCMNSKNFANFISALNPALGEAYKRDRWHSGTTGKGHNCRAPQTVLGITTGSYGVMR